MNFLNDESVFNSQRPTIASYPGGKSSKTKHKDLYWQYYQFVKEHEITRLIEPFCGFCNFFINVSSSILSAILNDADPLAASLLFQIKTKFN